ncbi:MAG: 2OG-Fe(II) oxygenase [Cyanobacteria bacterium P01_F01_bin.53]
MGLEIRRQYETGRLLNEEPGVYVLEDFLSDTEITSLVEAGNLKLQRALVSTDASGVVSKGRTGRNCWIPHDHSPTIRSLAKRISQLVELPLCNAESFQLIHYFQTQKYSAHYDAWEADTERGKRCMARGGQRLVTCLLYLNDVEKGGGTCFPKLDLEVAAKRGRMVIFHNCFAGTNVRHPNSLHGGMPVELGEKWACNLWFREKSREKEGAKQPKKTSHGQFTKEVARSGKTSHKKGAHRKSARGKGARKKGIPQKNVSQNSKTQKRKGFG